MRPFAANRAELDRHVGVLLGAARRGELAWLAYPKGRQLGTDLNRDILHDHMPSVGLNAVRQVAIDATWSALRFRPCPPRVGPDCTARARPPPRPRRRPIPDHPASRSPPAREEADGAAHVAAGPTRGTDHPGHPDADQGLEGAGARMPEREDQPARQPAACGGDAGGVGARGRPPFGAPLIPPNGEPTRSADAHHVPVGSIARRHGACGAQGVTSERRFTFLRQRRARSGNPTASGVNHCSSVTVPMPM